MANCLHCFLIVNIVVIAFKIQCNQFESFVSVMWFANVSQQGLPCIIVKRNGKLWLSADFFYNLQRRNCVKTSFVIWHVIIVTQRKKQVQLIAAIALLKRILNQGEIIFVFVCIPTCMHALHYIAWHGYESFWVTAVLKEIEMYCQIYDLPAHHIQTLGGTFSNKTLFLASALKAFTLTQSIMLLSGGQSSDY